MGPVDKRKVSCLVLLLLGTQHRNPAAPEYSIQGDRTWGHLPVPLPQGCHERERPRGGTLSKGHPGCGLIPGNGDALSCDGHRIMAGKLLACWEIVLEGLDQS